MANETRYLDLNGVSTLWAATKANASTLASTEASTRTADFASSDARILAEENLRGSKFASSDTRLKAEEDNRASAVAEEASIRAKAVTDEANTRGSAIAAEASTRTANDNAIKAYLGTFTSTATINTVVKYIDNLNTVEASKRASAVSNEASLRASEVASAVDSLDATVYGEVSASGVINANKHVGVKVVEADGKLTGVTVYETDIASASGLASAVTEYTSKIASAVSEASTATSSEASTRAAAITSANTRASSIEATASAEASTRLAKDNELASKIAVVQGDDTTKSMRTVAAEEVAKTVASADASYDTLKEIADWILSDQTGAASMAANITALNNKTVLGTYKNASGETVEYGTVKAYVEAEIANVNGDNATVASRVTILETKVGASTDTASATGTVYARIAQEVADRASAIAELDLTQVGADGKFIKLVSETNGKVSATAVEFATAVTSGNTATAPTGDAIYSYVENIVNGLDATASQTGTGEGKNGLTLQVVEADGKLTSVSGSIATITTDDLEAILV